MNSSFTGIKEKTGPFFYVSLFCMAILFHQSSILFGVNFSIADFFCIFFVISLIVQNQLLIPIIPLLFYLFVVILVTLTAVFYVPIVLGIETNMIRIGSDFIKLSASFLYFLLGFTLTQKGFFRTVIKWYSYAGVAIGTLGIVMTILNVKVFSSLLYYADVRYRGLMIDPNYFSVLLVTSYVFFNKNEEIKSIYKTIIFFLVLGGVLVAGSKTGLLTLCVYVCIQGWEYLRSYKKNVAAIITSLLIISLILLVFPIITAIFQNEIQQLANSRPALERVYVVFDDLDGAISGSGSERDTTWRVALEMIALSPYVGVGIGSYTTVANEFFLYNNVAHNTFLQLAAEWGLPVASIFFLYVFFQLFKVWKNTKQFNCNAIIVTHILFILMVGSMAITLSNARPLWFFLGVLIYYISQHRKEKARRLSMLNREKI